MRKQLLALILIGLFSVLSFSQQPQKPTASEIYHNLQKLNFLGSALYVAAHPDDENTRLISWLANDKKARTAYLSMTRGDGGQNLIGPEIRELLGVIRTQELLAARRTDGGQQFFTRANDFGYSKHPDETLEIWNKEEVLGDVVRAIRKFKPDVIINRFNHRDPGSNHGHHTSSAMLSMEAFDLAGDASNYPASAKRFGTWQPKRLLFNTSWWFYGSEENFEKADKTNLIKVETGTYFPALGLSNGEIAALSRSMHKSQGFGSSGTRGMQSEWLEFLKGDFPEGKNDLFEGINTSWSRVEGGAAIGTILLEAERNFNFEDPSAMLPQLLQAYEMVKLLQDEHWRTIKMEQLEQLILDCGGIFLEVVSNSNEINPNDTYELTIEAINRSTFPVVLQSVTSASGTEILTSAETLQPNERFTYTTNFTTKNNSTSAPYWLVEKGSLGMYKVPDSLIGVPETPAPERFDFKLGLSRTTLNIGRNVVYKFTDPVKGEVYQPMEILPKVSTSIVDKVLIFPNSEPKRVAVQVRAGKDGVNGFLQLNHPEGWTVNPPQHTFDISKQGDVKTFHFTVTPPETQSEGILEPVAAVGSKFYNKELISIDYEHIPLQRVLLPAEAKVVRIDLKKEGEVIGYIEGAGDAIPENLHYIGYRVENIATDEISPQKLQAYDAIVIGIRAYNTVPELEFKQQLLHDYVKNGGVLVLQYNTSHRLITEELAPYPLNLSRDRVTDESSEVVFLSPNHRVLNRPNQITQRDFEGWVQERGLYFPDSWDPAFVPVLGMNDEGEELTKGSLLIAEHGKGYFVYTGLSFFRELPAGVAGAYRLFANILSLGN